MTRFYVDGSLDVMKPLDRGEEELFTIPARSKYGDGVIIVTNFGLAVHTHKTGAILDLSHSEISSIEDAKDGRLCIKWIESQVMRIALENYNFWHHVCYWNLI